MKGKIILVVGMLLVLAASCNKQSSSGASGEQQSLLEVSGEQQSASLDFKTIAVDEFVKHPRAKSDVMGLHYHIRFIYPSQYKNKAVLEALQRKFTAYVLEERYASLTPEAAVKACIQDWKKEYDKDTKTDLLIYEYTCTDTLLFMNDDLLQMQTYSYTLQGGAHGFGGFSSHLFNLHTGKEYSRDDIFKSDKADEIRRTITDAVRDYLGMDDEEDTPDFDEDVWTEQTNFAVTKEGIILTYYNSLGYNLIQDPIVLPYNRIMVNLREDTPVWELFKEAAMSELNESSRALLAKEGLSIGSTLEDLLKRYPKCNIEIYYTDMGSFQYTSLEEMLNAYGEDWYSAYNDWAIFTPLKPNGGEMGIRFFISFKDLDNRNKYQKQSKIWLISD